MRCTALPFFKILTIILGGIIMPRVNNKYVCPAWKDNAAPAIDAAELLAIGQSIVANQTDIETLKTAIAAASGAAKIQTGSYVGTGTYGASNPCSLTFDFSPAILSITTKSGYGEIRGNDTVLFSYLPIQGTRYKFDGNTVTWAVSNSSSYDAGDQQNESGKTYYYVAIGKE